MENEQDEEEPKQSINTDKLPSTADLSDVDGPIQLLSINRNNNWQQPSPFKQILRPSLVPGTDGHVPKLLRWQSIPCRLIFHNCYQHVHYAPDCNLKFREYPTIFLNYEKLNVDYKAIVPVTLYNQEWLIFEAFNESKITADVKKAESINYLGDLCVHHYHIL